jgi:hypothetical protein
MRPLLKLTAVQQQREQQHSQQQRNTSVGGS